MYSEIIFGTGIPRQDETTTRDGPSPWLMYSAPSCLVICVFIPTDDLGSSKQALGGDYFRPHCIVGHMSGVQNLWSHDDQKGYSPEDQIFLPENKQ